MYKLFLAGRYTLGRPVSYLAMVAIGLAVMALIAVSSIMNGFLEETERVLRGSTADITVSQGRFARGAAVREEWEAKILEHPLVEAVASRYVRPAVFKVKGSNFLNRPELAEQFVVKVVGIDIEQERQATDFDAYLARVEDDLALELERIGVADEDIERRVAQELGGYLVKTPEEAFNLDRGLIQRAELRYAPLPRMLMSLSRMRYFGLEKGSALELVTIPDTDAEVGGGSIDTSNTTFLLSGAFETGHGEFDAKTLFVPRDAFPGWAGTQDEFSEIVLRCTPGSDLSVIRDDLIRSFGGQANVETWEDKNAIWLGAVKNERNILFVLFGFFLLLVCTITFCVLTMLVQQKVRDIGILSSMGATASGIGTVFALSGVLIATLGGLFGLVSGMLLNAYINDVKDFIEWLFDIEIFNKAVYAFSEIPVAEDSLMLNLAITGATVVGAVAICLLPALRAGRMDPVEALRHD